MAKKSRGTKSVVDHEKGRNRKMDEGVLFVEGDVEEGRRSRLA